MRRTTKKRWALGFALSSVAFVVNPALMSGCEASFEYGEKELVAVLESVNQTERFTFEHEGSKYELTLALEQVEGADETSARETGLTRAAHACSQRTFMRSAAACLDETLVPVKGKVTLKRLASQAEVLLDGVDVEGTLLAEGTRLGRVHVNLESTGRRVSLRSADAKTFELEEVYLGEGSALRYFGG
jgi:hypothetical protein